MSLSKPCLPPGKFYTRIPPGLKPVNKSYGGETTVACQCPKCKIICIPSLSKEVKIPTVIENCWKDLNNCCCCSCNMRCKKCGHVFEWSTSNWGCGYDNNILFKWDPMMEYIKTQGKSLFPDIYPLYFSD